MTTFTKLVILDIAAADQSACNQFMAALGYDDAATPSTFGPIRLSEDGQEPVTRYAAMLVVKEAQAQMWTDAAAGTYSTVNGYTPAEIAAEFGAITIDVSDRGTTAGDVAYLDTTMAGRNLQRIIDDSI